MSDTARWYVVHTYSGYENTVKTSIEKIVENRNLHDYIVTVTIPTEMVTEITDNETKTVERKLFPGYVLVKMIMTDEAWYLIKNVRGVTGFVGFGTKPTPLSDDEVSLLGMEKHEIIVRYNVGESVKITDGPLEGYIGTVEEIDTEKGSVKLVVSMFGREMPVELELDQAERINI